MFAFVSPKLLGLLALVLPMPEGGSAWTYLIVASIACGAALLLKSRITAMRRG
jgi:hypothetical protein